MAFFVDTLYRTAHRGVSNPSRKLFCSAVWPELGVLFQPDSVLLLPSLKGLVYEVIHLVLEFSLATKATDNFDIICYFISDSEADTTFIFTILALLCSGWVERVQIWVSAVIRQPYKY